jgi:hypothetical protein
MFRVIEYARMLIGTKAMGTLSTGYLNALEYAKERKQGADLTEATDKTAPRVPIIAHPDVRRMLMTQKAHAEGMRALVLYAAWVQDQARLHPDDDTWERRNDLLLPLVKGYSSEKAYELLSMSLQVFGGSGYTMDYPIEQYIRDARSTPSTRAPPGSRPWICSSARSPATRVRPWRRWRRRSSSSSRAGPTATLSPRSVSCSRGCSTTPRPTSARWWRT